MTDLHHPAMPFITSTSVFTDHLKASGRFDQKLASLQNPKDNILNQ
jgi:hypothetical protein